MKITVTSFTLADVLADVEAHPEHRSPKKHRDTVKAIEKVAELLRCDIADLSADPVLLEEIIKQRLNWKACGYKSERTFDNIRSRVVAAAREAGLGAMPEFPQSSHYSPAWKALWADIRTAIKRGEEYHRVLRSLAHLAGYANWVGLEPHQVTSETLRDLMDLHAEKKRILRSLKLKPADYAATAIGSARTWNELVRAKNQKPWLNGLPATILEWEGKKEPLNPDVGDWPTPFRQDVEGYFRYLRHETLADPDATAANKRYSEFTNARTEVPETEVVLRDVPLKRRRSTPVGEKRIAKLTSTIRQTVGALVRFEEMRLEDFQSLRDITTMTALKASLTDQKERLEADARFNPAAGTRCGIADNLIQIAKYVGWHDAHIAEMQTIRNNPAVKTESVGNMSVDHRKMLDQFDNPWAAEAWLKRPAELFARAEAARRASAILEPRHLVDMETAILLELSRVLPTRPGNRCLVRHKGEQPNLFLARHPGENSWLAWERGETKNRRRLRAPLTPEAERMIRIYIEHYRPQYIERYEGTPDSDFLFPGRVYDKRAKGHRCVKSLCDNLRNRMAEIGINMTAHLDRHVIAQAVLDHDPGLLHLVADLLGDKPETVKKFYIDGRTERASLKLRTIFSERMNVLLDVYKDLLLPEAA